MICLHFFYQISLLQSNKKIKMEKSYVRDQNFIKDKKKLHEFILKVKLHYIIYTKQRANKMLSKSK